MFCFAATLFLEARVGDLAEVGNGRSRPPLARVRARGAPRARRVGPLLFWDFDGLFCQPEGHRDPRTQSVQGLFVREGGDFSAPSQALFHTHFLSRPRFFFGVLLWPSRPLRNAGELDAITADGRLNSEHEVRELL